MPSCEKLALSYEELRAFVLETFKDSPRTQYVSLCNNLAHKLISKGLVSNPLSGYTIGGDVRLCRVDEDRVREMIWDLVVERIVNQ